jgi:predicted nucleic acid-binding protein
MVLVDTNVAAYLLIAGEHTAAAQRLHRQDGDWRSEAFILVEFANVLAGYIAAKRMNLAQATNLLARADQLFAGKLARVPHLNALALAVRWRITAYDARFLALAARLDTRLVTEDARLRAAAPALTQSLSDALASK